ncbi:MAG: twin-arginine translocation pathway signal protein [Hirschia sp.]|nr:twin-arginine translocation pathway signal protein [Hirschia sp.]MBF17314.1 twin-arginine translocation pathway signal protein [Hirschia sp.]|tara:strand:- start:49 stop:525 length:477 start_codon:yes stop_codon:yes gene_type:complete
MSTQGSGRHPRQFYGLLAVIALVWSAPMAVAEKAPVYTGLFSDVAVGGYDPVSYFSGMPQQGSDQFSMEYQGAEFRFASQENLDAFKLDPTAYAPQYGGYCAWAAAQGNTAKGDPRYWKIVDGKLYLNYNAKVQKDWEKNIPLFIEKADANWPDILGK